MTNFELEQRVKAIIDTVFELLDEQHLYKLIDEPIDKTIASFKLDNETPVTHDYFIENTSRFVRHIYQQGPFIRLKLSKSQAYSEATAILEQIFKNPGTNATGYEMAYLYALNDIEYVLAQISDYIKLVSRDKYKRWVYASYIDSLDWMLKCQIVDTLIKQSTCLPPDIAGRPSFLFVDDIPELIDTITSSEQLAYHLLNAGFLAESA